MSRLQVRGGRPGGAPRRVMRGGGGGAGGVDTIHWGDWGHFGPGRSRNSCRLLWRICFIR